MAERELELHKIKHTLEPSPLGEVARQLVKEKYPGVELESPIQGWVYLKDYYKGIETFENTHIYRRDSKDTRWVGVCMFQLRDDHQAVPLFQTAVYQGVKAAGINLAQVYMFTDRMNLAMPELEKINFEELKLYDKVFFLRVRSYYYELNARLTDALNDAELAWGIAQNIPEWPIIAPQLLRQLGTLYGRMGKAQRSFWFFEQSLLLASDSERFDILFFYIEVLIMLGYYLEARSELEKIDSETLSEVLQATYYLRWGDIFWTERATDKAIEVYDKAAFIALQKELYGEEFIARVNLIPLNIARDYPLTAGEHQARARTLIADKTDQLLYRFRDTLLMLKENLATTTETRDTLLGLSDELKELGYLQEHGWVKLHAAEMKRRLGEDVMRDLDELQLLAATLQNYNFLSREWALLPELYAIAQETHPKIAGKAPGVIELFTMGEERVVHNGKTVPIPLRRAVEVIAYFLDNGGKVSLKKLRADLFPDDDPKTSRNYFHQFRHELHARIPVFKIVYDSEQHMYEIKTDLTVLWDVAELREGRKMGGMGLFLPSSGSEWAELMEYSLQPLRDELTPEILKKYYASIGGNPATSLKARR
jgi:tetratricopeptide (TPR) repeat protein